MNKKADPHRKNKSGMTTLEMASTVYKKMMLDYIQVNGTFRNLVAVYKEKCAVRCGLGERSVQSVQNQRCYVLNCSLLCEILNIGVHFRFESSFGFARIFVPTQHLYNPRLLFFLFYPARV